MNRSLRYLQIKCVRVLEEATHAVGIIPADGEREKD